MAKEFYTEKDIEDLFNRGIKSLQLTENVVLTELAYEKARRLEFQLISGSADHPPLRRCDLIFRNGRQDQRLKGNP